MSTTPRAFPDGAQPEPLRDKASPDPLDLSQEQPDGRPSDKGPANIDLTRRDSVEQPRLPHENDQSPDSMDPTTSPIDRERSDKARDDQVKGRKDTGLKPVVDTITERQDREAGTS